MDGLKNKKTFISGFLILALAVILGAFGAHGLEKHLSDKALETYKTGNFYHFIHGLAWIFLALFEQNTRKSFNLSKVLLGLGLTFFTGFCYLYAMTSIKFLALLIPLGGIAYTLFWFRLAYIVWKIK